MSGAKGIGGLFAKGLESSESHIAAHMPKHGEAFAGSAGAKAHPAVLRPGGAAPRQAPSQTRMQNMNGQGPLFASRFTAEPASTAPGLQRRGAIRHSPSPSTSSGEKISPHDMQGRPLTGKLTPESSPYHSAGSDSSSSQSLHYGTIPEHQPRRYKIPGTKAYEKFHAPSKYDANGNKTGKLKAFFKKLDPFASKNNIQAPGAHLYEGSPSSSVSSVAESRWDNGHMMDHASETPLTGGYGEGRFDRR